VTIHPSWLSSRAWITGLLAMPILIERMSA
jgi:hypothetical protein